MRLAMSAVVLYIAACFFVYTHISVGLADASSFGVSKTQPLNSLFAAFAHVSWQHFTANAVGLMVVTLSFAAITLVHPRPVRVVWERVFLAGLLAGIFVPPLVELTLDFMGRAYFPFSVGASAAVYEMAGLTAVASLFTVRTVVYIKNVFMASPDTRLIAVGVVSPSVMLFLIAVADPVLFLGVGKSAFLGHLYGLVIGFAVGVAGLERPKRHGYRVNRSLIRRLA